MLGPNEVARCLEHCLCYVDAREIVESGGDPLLGSTIAGRFAILGRLGAGSMGAVYRARQEAVGRDVALKIVQGERALDPETKARFEREARATSALVSPHTVTVFDFGEAQGGCWFLAMERLEGETLGERLKRVTRLSVPDAIRIASEAASSLGEAHAKGIIHRDLKPDNLFLARMPEGREMVKVLDFGIAKLVHGDQRRVDQLETQAGTVFGTPRYMSPEQAQGSPLDARSDLYSLGVIIYQMLAGRPPFVDEDAVVVMARHIKTDPPALSEAAPDALVPPAVEAVVRHLLRKQPDERIASADALIAELGGALSSSVQGTGVHATWAGPAAGPVRPGRALIVLGGVAALLVLGIGGFLLVKQVMMPAPSAGPSVGAVSAPAGLAPPTAAPEADASTALPREGQERSAAPSRPAPAPSSTRPPDRSRHPAAGTPRPPAATKDRGYGRFE